MKATTATKSVLSRVSTARAAPGKAATKAREDKTQRQSRQSALQASLFGEDKENPADKKKSAKEGAGKKEGKKDAVAFGVGETIELDL